jgi:hypothetical protein
MKSPTFSTSIPHAAVFASLLAFGITAFAQSSSSDQPPAQGGHRHGPSPEAIAACANKAANDTCSFARRDGDTAAGKCTAPHANPDKSDGSDSSPPLACRPDRSNKPAPAAGSGN